MMQCFAATTEAKAPFTQDTEHLANYGTYCNKWDSHRLQATSKGLQQICLQICLLVLCERGLRIQKKERSQGTFRRRDFPLHGLFLHGRDATQTCSGSFFACPVVESWLLCRFTTEATEWQLQYQARNTALEKAGGNPNLPHVV